MTTSWARSRAPSLPIAWLTWVRAVAGLRDRSAPISWLLRPSPDQGEHLALALGQHREPVLGGLGGRSLRR